MMSRDHRVDPLLRPPTEADKVENPLQKNVVWFASFKKADADLAAKNKKSACKQFRSILPSKEFPLYDLVVLKAHESCSQISDLPSLQTLNKNSLSWFEESYIRARLAHDSELSFKDRVELLWDQSRLEKLDRPRENFLKKAVTVARASGDPSLVNAANEKLWQFSPRLNPNPAKEDMNQVVRDLRKWRQFNKAIRIERSRLKQKRITADEHYRILRSIRDIYKVSQQRDEMLKATADVLNYAKKSFKLSKKNSTSSKRLLDAHVLYVRTVWTENRRDLALKSLNEARRELQGKVSLEEIFYLYSRMAEEVKDLKEAEAYLQKALSETSQVAGLRDKMEWSRAWLLHKMKRSDEATAAFQAIAENSKDTSETAKAMFWKSRYTKDAREREKELEKIRDMDPLGFYGLMAMRDLGKPLAPIQSPSDKANLTLWISSEFPLYPSLIAEWLIALGDHESLVFVLNDLQSDLRKNKSASTDSWLRLAASYARGGEFLPLFTLMGQLSPDVRDQLIKEKPELLFPKPWKEEVQSAAQKARVPPELIYSIMRQESAFNPRARSPAEAYGLMQLLPNVAARLAKKFRSPYEGPESLYNPEIIIPLGAFELRTLFDRWKGVWVPSIASYNAAEKAVRGWMKVRKREDPIEFIEEIPYEETRNYIKLVLRNQVFYQRLLATEPTPFPESCLNIFQ